MPKTLLNAQGSAAPAHERTGRLDWSNLRFFLELSRTGSLSRAAKELGVDRNTVGRRVAALEEELGLALFERGPQGWTRTAAGEELAGLASRVEEDVLALARHADARDRALTGSARLTAPMHVTFHLLVPALPALRARHPGLRLEIAADARIFSLTRREADLAVRMGRPREASDAGVVARKLVDLAYRFYAAKGSEAARRGTIDLAHDRFVGFGEGLSAVPEERWLARVAPDREIVFRSNSTTALAAAVRSDVGVAVLPCFVADPDPHLVRLDGPEPSGHELWLLVHGDLRRTPRVKAVIEWVDELVARGRKLLTGQG
jgi:DNA-binding transcriptional LysR family regulator